MKYKIIIEASVNDSPKEHEFSAAIVIAEYFQSDVIFVRPGVSKTPDFKIEGATWELKSPLGSSARTIENNMRTARKQSENIIIDLARTKIHQQRAIARINFFLSKPSPFKKVLVITKTRKIIEIR
jgi:hypothetical protein